jgi:RHS repeat-associated protein
VRQKFTGYERDDETGLDFAEARYYYNNHGRFTAVDPLLASGRSADPQTFNRYAYVMNRPLILTDSTGLQVATDPLIRHELEHEAIVLLNQATGGRRPN